MENVERVELRTPDGVTLDAALHRPASGAVGRVLQVHGITADLDEGGMFERLANQLASRGFDVLRFSFRGHGRSSGEQRGVTIGGEMLDFVTAYDYLEHVAGGEAAVVAASFGAVAAVLGRQREHGSRLRAAAAVARH
jgi:uncharacterized protein